MIPIRVYRGEAGFTLMETLVVVAIIGMATVVAIPYLVKSGRRQRLVGAAHEIQQSLLAARMRAVRANQNTSLVIVAATAAEPRHELGTVAPDNSPAPLPTPVSRTYIAASAVEFVTLPLNNKVTFAGDGRVIAPPAPTPGVITVQGPAGSAVNQVTIRANSTGRIEVVTPAVWQ